MARKRTEFGPETEARIVALMRRGGTSASIAAALAAEGVKVSRATIGRRMGELKGRVNSERAQGRAVAPSPSQPAPEPADEDEDVPEVVPAGASLEIVDKWIPKVEAAAEAAEREGDLSAFATLTAKLVTLLEHRRKAAPPEKIDPNDRPDMVELGAKVAERLHKAVDIVARWR